MMVEMPVLMHCGTLESLLPRRPFVRCCKTEGFGWRDAKSCRYRLLRSTVVGRS
ncbi:unnamed protein product [Ixodes pacificus]